jgi:hypothetical protein
VRPDAPCYPDIVIPKEYKPDVGCGRLVALPLLFVVGICATVRIYGEHVTQKDLVVAGSIRRGAGGTR